MLIKIRCRDAELALWPAIDLQAETCNLMLRKPMKMSGSGCLDSKLRK